MNTAARTEFDALDLLMQDHREIESLLSEFDHRKKSGQDTRAIIAAACAELKMHDTLENSIFYPAIGDAAEGAEIEAVLDAAENEHDVILELIEKLERSGVDGEQRNTRFAVLAQHVLRHIEREERELFPLVRKLPQIDIASISSVLKERQTELMTESGGRATSAAIA